jgi:hypothetical protein
VKTMTETRIAGACSCGRKVTKILNSEVPTMWKNGDRYIYPERDDKWGIFRCEDCKEPIDETWTATDDAVATGPQ